MSLYTPLETLSSCLASAQYVDMSEVLDKKRKPNSKPFDGKRTDYDAYQACVHHHGEGLFQNPIKWTYRDDTSRKGWSSISGR